MMSQVDCTAAVAATIDEPEHVTVLYGGDYGRRRLTASKLHDFYPHPLPLLRQDRSVHHPSVRALMDAMDHVTVVASYNPYSRTMPIEHHIVPRAQFASAATSISSPAMSYASELLATPPVTAISAKAEANALPPLLSFVSQQRTPKGGHLCIASAEPADASTDSFSSTATTTPIRTLVDGLSSDEDECLTPPNTPASDLTKLPHQNDQPRAPWMNQQPLVLDGWHPASRPTLSPTASAPRVSRLYYFVTPTTFPDYYCGEENASVNGDEKRHVGGTQRRIMFGPRCSTELAHLPRYKLGGLCCEIQDIVVAHILFLATGVIVAGADMFTNCKGCCSVWLRSEADVQKLTDGIHQRLWTLPTQLGYCLLSKNAEGRAYLESQIHDIASPFPHLRFPRHMVTVQRYLDFSEHRPRNQQNGKHPKAAAKKSE